MAGKSNFVGLVLKEAEIIKAAVINPPLWCFIIEKVTWFSFWG